MVIALLIFSTSLFCQVTEKTIPDSTFILMQKHTQNTLNQLYDNSYNAYDTVAWESLVLNGIDYSYDYWDAYDYEEEDYFVEDMIAYISSKLKTTGVDDNIFTDWKFEKQPDDIIATCHNINKDITIKTHLSSYNTIYVTEMDIKDRIK